jgi:hypothetical protein
MIEENRYTLPLTTNQRRRQLLTKDNGEMKKHRLTSHRDNDPFVFRKKHLLVIARKWPNSISSVPHKDLGE